MRSNLLWLSLLLLSSACARPPRYQVYVTGYTGGTATSISAGASVAVMENPEAPNPLLEQEVVGKVRRALATQGFPPAPLNAADVVVILRYGADSRLEFGEETQYVPGQQSTVKDSSGKVIGTVTSDASSVTVPTTSTTQLQWLTMTALDGRRYRESKPGKPLWIGETKNSGANLDLRSMLDYFVIPTVAAFGRNQPQSRTTVRADDLAVRALGAHH